MVRSVASREEVAEEEEEEEEVEERELDCRGRSRGCARCSCETVVERARYGQRGNAVARGGGCSIGSG